MCLSIAVKKQPSGRWATGDRSIFPSHVHRLTVGDEVRARVAARHLHPAAEGQPTADFSGRRHWHHAVYGPSRSADATRARPRASPRCCCSMAVAMAASILLRGDCGSSRTCCRSSISSRRFRRPALKTAARTTTIMPAGSICRRSIRCCHAGRLAYLCGSPDFTASMTARLVERGMPRFDIFAEAFASPPIVPQNAGAADRPHRRQQPELCLVARTRDPARCRPGGGPVASQRLPRRPMRELRHAHCRRQRRTTRRRRRRDGPVPDLPDRSALGTHARTLIETMKRKQHQRDNGGYDDRYDD